MLPLRRDTVPCWVPAHFLRAGDWGLLAGQRVHTPLQHSPTWKPCSQINGASVAINCHQGKCRHLSGTLFTGLGNEEAGGKRSLFHSLILKRMNEMAGAFNFFTGDLKESQMCAARHCKSCPSSLEGWHLPELFLLVVKSQASASLSPHWDVGNPMSWSITVPLHQPSCTMDTTIFPAALDQPMLEHGTPAAPHPTEVCRWVDLTRLDLQWCHWEGRTQG